jgi:uncharacterized membrane protein YqiK
VTVEPVVAAEDDYGVGSVSLKANGTRVAVRSVAPYVFTWTPTVAEIGTSVHLEATITDSAGQVTTSNVTVPVVKSTGETTAEQEAKEKQEAEEKAAEEAKEEKEAAEQEVKEVKEAAEQEVKEAKEAAELATKEAEEKATAATLAAAESAEAALKAAEAKAEASVKEAAAKAAAAQKEAKEAKDAAEAVEKSLLAAAPPAAGKAVKNTKQGTARLKVTVPSPGSLVISGPEIDKVSGNPTAPGGVQVLIKAKGKALKTLKKKGKVTVEVDIEFTGTAGPKETTTMVTLVKK